MSTSLMGGLNAPPKTYIWLQKLSARVLLVARGMSAIVVDGISHRIIDKGVCRIGRERRP